MSKGLLVVCLGACSPGCLTAGGKAPSGGGRTERGLCPLGSQNTETAHEQLQGSAWLPVCPPSPVSPPVRVHPPTWPVFNRAPAGRPCPGPGGHVACPRRAPILVDARAEMHQDRKASRHRVPE